MESVLEDHPECAITSCVRHFRVTSGDGTLLADVGEHHQTRWRLDLHESLLTDTVVIEILETWGALPAIYEVRCY